MRPSIPAAILGGFLSMLSVGTCMAVAPVIRKDLPYTLHGKTVAELNRQLARHGKDHVLITVQPDSEVRYAVSGSTCAVKSVKRMVYVTVRYPVLAAGAPPALQKRWDALMSVLMRPVDFHVRQARFEAAALNAFWRQDFSMPRDPKCIRLKKVLTGKAVALTDRYDGPSALYHARQTQPGGPIARATVEFNKAPQP